MLSADDCQALFPNPPPGKTQFDQALIVNPLQIDSMAIMSTVFAVEPIKQPMNVFQTFVPPEWRKLFQTQIAASVDQTFVAQRPALVICLSVCICWTCSRILNRLKKT